MNALITRGVPGPVVRTSGANEFVGFALMVGLRVGSDMVEEQWR